MWNFISHTKERKQDSGVWQQDVEGDIWTKEGGNNREVEKTT